MTRLYLSLMTRGRGVRGYIQWLCFILCVRSVTHHTNCCQFYTRQIAKTTTKIIVNIIVYCMNYEELQFINPVKTDILRYCQGFVSKYFKKRMITFCLQLNILSFRTVWKYLEPKKWKKYKEKIGKAIKNWTT